MHKNLTLGDLQDYELLDSGDQLKLERFGSYVLGRPETQAIWRPGLERKDWERANAVFKATNDKFGHSRPRSDVPDKWMLHSKMPEKWLMHHKKLAFYAKLAPFKHTGVFPEQAVQWDWMSELIKKSKREVNVLNLFAYTGIATLACAEAGAKVTHVDSSYPAIGWAKANQIASKLQDKPIRWIEDDVVRFVSREINRGAKYDGIIMDPPVRGHGANGEVWSFNDSFPKLVSDCSKLLSDNPLFFLVNAYAVSFYPSTLENILMDHLPDENFECGEICIKEKSLGRMLSTGIYARWTGK